MTNALIQTEIYLSKSRKVLLPAGHTQATPEIVATAASNLRDLGFGLTPAVLDRLRMLSDQEVVEWFKATMPILRRLVGSHKEYKPMYPNFPRQVMEASDAELFFNAMANYYGFYLSDVLGDPSLVVLPNYTKEPREAFEEAHALRWIDLGSTEDFAQLFTRMVSANSSLSEYDKQILSWFAETMDVRSLIPEHIPQKETLAYLVSLVSIEVLEPAIKTATDVLRVAVALSGGDVSLAEPTKFRNFTKSERRQLLSCLERTGSSRTEDMLRWKSRWLRLGERLHPGDYAARFPESLHSFDILRNNTPHRTFNSIVEEHMRARSQNLPGILSARPGEFARRLDQLLRYMPQDRLEIIEQFFSVAHDVSTPVLLQAWGHFVHRHQTAGRAFFPKGNAAKVQFKESPLPKLPDMTAEEVAQGLRRELVDRFSSLPSLGQVFIDPRLRYQLVPFAQRSASRALRTVARGSSFELPPGDTIRLFCWWRNIELPNGEQERVDLDLAASVFAADWKKLGDLSYYQLRLGGDGVYQGVHSGDITSAPNGACEFIDLSLGALGKTSVRYIVMSIFNFTRQSFVNMPECFSGWMMRARPESGEIFEARTVQDKIDITAGSNVCVPVIIDVKERRAYWADLGLKSACQLNNAANRSVGISRIGEAIVNLRKPTLYDLFSMHAEARGHLVADQGQADTVFGLTEGTVTAFDSAVIGSEYLA